jgi:hypothetical protein
MSSSGAACALEQSTSGAESTTMACAGATDARSVLTAGSS